MKLSTLDNVKNIDLKDTKTITILIILCIVLFAIIYIWQNKKNTTEGFSQYNINSGDLVALYGLDNVVVGSSNPLSLTSTLNTLIDARNASTLSNTYAKNSDLANTNMNLTSNASTLLSTITNLQNQIASNLAMVNQIVTSNVALMNTNLTSNITAINTVMGNTPPPFSIVAIYSKDIPTGWQLCDGSLFKAMNNEQVFIMEGSGTATPMNTPNLLGRTIVGATPEEWMNNASANITKREIGDSGGTETHTLTVNEMPAHSHTPYASRMYGNFGPGGVAWWQIGEGGNPYGLQGNVTSTGGNAPHNNMQPFVAITYIIKRPLLGGSANAYEVEFNSNYLQG